MRLMILVALLIGGQAFSPVLAGKTGRPLFSGVCYSKIDELSSGLCFKTNGMYWGLLASAFPVRGTSKKQIHTIEITGKWTANGKYVVFDNSVDRDRCVVSVSSRSKELSVSGCFLKGQWRLDLETMPDKALSKAD